MLDFVRPSENAESLLQCGKECAIMRKPEGRGYFPSVCLSQKALNVSTRSQRLDRCCLAFQGNEQSLREALALRSKTRHPVLPGARERSVTLALLFRLCKVSYVPPFSAWSCVAPSSSPSLSDRARFIPAPALPPEASYLLSRLDLFYKEPLLKSYRIPVASYKAHHRPSGCVIEKAKKSKKFFPRVLEKSFFIFLVALLILRYISTYRNVRRTSILTRARTVVGFSSISFRQRVYGLIFGSENKSKGAKGFPWGTGGGIPQGKALNEIGCRQKRRRAQKRCSLRRRLLCNLHQTKQRRLDLKGVYPCQKPANHSEPSAKVHVIS